MTIKIAGLVVWMLFWIIGCAVFVSWLDLRGLWLMLGGALTFMVCEFAQKIVLLFGDAA